MKQLRIFSNGQELSNPWLRVWTVMGLGAALGIITTIVGLSF